MKDVKPSIASESPLRLLLLLGCSIFGAEMFSHVVIHGLLPEMEWIEGFADSTFLLALLFSCIYFFVFRPLKLSNTERKQAEKVAYESEKHYRTLFTQAMDGILVLDMEGNIVSVNQSFARMHGYSMDELLAMSLSELDTPQILVSSPERFARILTGELKEFEVEHFHKDGHIVPLHVTASAINVDGKSMLLAFHRDITELRLAFQELKRSHAELCTLSKAASEALEDERRRTARELHDELGQALTVLKLDLESLRSNLPPNEPNLNKRAQEMNAKLDVTVAATRRIAANLRPMMLDDLGLAVALDWLTQNFSEHTGIAANLNIDDRLAQVQEPIASALFRITQESLTNVTKYAQATRVDISIEYDGNWILLTVRDNGRGIDVADQNKPGHFGLLGIRERVILLSGEFAVMGKPGLGTEVRVRIPLVIAETLEVSI